MTLAGTALLYAAIGVIVGLTMQALYQRCQVAIRTMTNETLVAVPLFILMGVTLERAKIAEQLLASMASAMGRQTADWVSQSLWLVPCWLRVPGLWQRW